MESKKFLFTTSFYPPYHLGGDAIHVKYLSEELSRRGHEVHVFHSLDAYKVKRKQSLKKDEQDGIYTHRIETPFNSSSYAAYILGNSSAITKKFDNLIREIKPDIVHHHNISLLGYNLLRKRNNYINLYTAHDYWLACQQVNLLKGKTELCQRHHKGSCFFCSLKCRRPAQIWRSSKNFKKAIEDIDLLISPSNFLERTLAKSISAKTITLPNFVPSPPNIIDSADVSNYFLFAGMLEKHKGILNLLQAIKDLRREISLKLVILGDGSLKKTVINFIKKESLANLVIYRGFVGKEEIYPLYKNAIALIIPSICAENAPLTALEALSVGTPIIASNVGGLPEIVNKCNKRLLFNNPDELKNLLCTFSKDEILCANAQQAYIQCFSKDAYFNMYFDEIRKIGGKN